MCTFITLAFPRETDPKALKLLLQTHQLADKPTENPSVQALLPPGSLYYVTTRGLCSCGTALGSLYRAIPPESLIPTDGEISRLRKKGWSAARIARWQEEKTQAKGRWENQQHTIGESRDGEVSLWLDFFRAAVRRAGNIPPLAEWVILLLHFYGSMDGPIKISRSENLITEEITADTLLHLEYDVLYRFSR